MPRLLQVAKSADMRCSRPVGVALVANVVLFLKLFHFFRVDAIGAKDYEPTGSIAILAILQ
jgi:hypothetical protein